MQPFDSIRELRNEKKYDTTNSINMSVNNSSESSPILNALEGSVIDESDARTLKQEEIDEQMRKYIAPLARQLEDLTRPIQGIYPAQLPNSYPRAGISASFSAAIYQPEILIYGRNLLLIRFWCLFELWHHTETVGFESLKVSTISEIMVSNNFQGGLDISLVSINISQKSCFFDCLIFLVSMLRLRLLFFLLFSPT